MARKKKKNLIQNQIKNINNRVRETFAEINAKQEKVVTSILILAQTKATFYTPQDTNNLINSQYRQVRREGNSTRGRVGYTQDYALALHGDQTKSPLWKPRPADSPGKKGGGYNPNAKPRYLERGAEEEIDNMRRVIIEMNKI